MGREWMWVSFTCHQIRQRSTSDRGTVRIRHTDNTPGTTQHCPKTVSGVCVSANIGDTRHRSSIFDDTSKNGRHISDGGSSADNYSSAPRWAKLACLCSVLWLLWPVLPLGTEHSVAVALINQSLAANRNSSPRISSRCPVASLDRSTSTTASAWNSTTSLQSFFSTSVNQTQVKF